MKSDVDQHGFILTEFLYNMVFNDIRNSTGKINSLDLGNLGNSLGALGRWWTEILLFLDF